MILGADVGGTKTELALFERGGLSVVRGAVFRSREHASLEAVLRIFLKGEPIEAACLAVAGMVLEGRTRLTNLPWEVDEGALARVLGTPTVKVVNDLQAAAYGMLFLAPQDFEVLNAGRPRDGNIAVIAPGTGLGEAILFWDGRRHHPIATEGGHADFAPRTELEIELLRFMRAKMGAHVSWERLLSGAGIQDIFSFLVGSAQAPLPEWLKDRLLADDPAAEITEIGLAGRHPLCVETIELFCSLLGAEAGDQALKCLATGGVVLGGGIPPKILPALRQAPFMRAFADKGRFSEMLREIPVRVCLRSQAPLIGAAQLAVRDIGT